MHRPCATRRRVKAVRSGALARSAVGIARTARLTRMPNPPSIQWLEKATAKPGTATPLVLVLPGKPMAAGVTAEALASDGRMACVANRSTTVRKAVSPITRLRRSTPRAWMCAWIAAFGATATSSDITRILRRDLFGGERHVRHLLVQNDALERVGFVLPGHVRQRPTRRAITGFPALADPGRGEVDILGVVLVVETRRQQTHHVHAREAAVTGQLAHLGIGAPVLRQMPGKLADHPAQPMHLPLARNVARHPARIFGFLVAGA